MYKEKSDDNKLFVKPEFWHKTKIGLLIGLFWGGASVILVNLVALVGLWRVSIPKSFIFDFFLYHILGSFLGLAGGICIIYFVMKYLLKKAYFQFNNNVLLINFLSKKRIQIDKLKRIEQVVDSKTGECLALKFYSSQALVFGAIRIDDMMFDLGKIVSQLKKMDSIPQDIWLEKLKSNRSINNHPKSIIFIFVLFFTLICWVFVFINYESLNSRPHGLLYIFPTSFILQAGVYKIGFSIITFNFVLSLLVNFLLCISAYNMSKLSVSIKTLTLKITLWIGVSVAVLLLLLYNYFCLTYYVIE